MHVRYMFETLRKAMGSLFLNRAQARSGCTHVICMQGKGRFTQLHSALVLSLPVLKISGNNCSLGVFTVWAWSDAANA